MNQQLYYHKCDDCLTAFSSTERHIDYCDCNGSVTFMGEVKGDNYVKTENRSPCDGRCTHACGPVCDCQCGGANHGTGKLVATIIVAGKVKVEKLSEEDVERAHMFRDFRDAAEKAFGERYGMTLQCIKTNVRVPYDEYRATLRARDKLDKVLALRQHMPRIKAIADFLVSMSKNP